MAVGAPDTLDDALAAGDAAVLVLVVVAVLVGGDAEGLDAAVGEADCKQRLGRVHHLREQVRRERQGAEVFQHGFVAFAAVRVFVAIAGDVAVVCKHTYDVR